MGDLVLGIVGRGFTLIAADQSVARSIVVFKQNEDKIAVIEPNKLMACAGPVGDRVHFTEYISKNIQLYGLRTGITLSTHATAEFTRKQLAEALRKGPYEVNLLIGGFDEKSGGELYYLDYLGSLHPVKFGAHGYASYFAYSMFDRYYKPDCSIEEAKDLIKLIVKELELRFVLKFGPIMLKVADKDGCREIQYE